MSYAKMMKWNRKHIKGAKQMYMGFDTSTPGEPRRHSLAFMEDYWEHRKECEDAGINYPTIDEYYDNTRHYNEILRERRLKDKKGLSVNGS